VLQETERNVGWKATESTRRQCKETRQVSDSQRVRRKALDRMLVSKLNVKITNQIIVSITLLCVTEYTSATRFRVTINFFQKVESRNQ
jgi:hypothetical protein